MADADRAGRAAGAPGVGPRACPDCGEALGTRVSFCPACGRFVPGGRRRWASIATVVGPALGLALVALVIVGYVWIPVVGFLAEAAVWVYAVLKGDWSVSGRRVLIGTGIGLLALAVVAVVMRLCGAGA